MRKSSNADIEPINNFGAMHRRTSSDASHGRYDKRSGDTRSPAAGLARMPVSRNADTTTAAVVDPMGNGKERLLATVNRRVDVLEWERSHGHISEAAYRTGRLIQACFEHFSAVGGSNWGDGGRVDPKYAQTIRLARSITNAEDALAMERRIRDRLGEVGTRLLRRVIGDGRSYADCAALAGRPGPKGTAYIASRFREAIEDLAEAWTAKGASRPVPNDKHRDVSVDAVRRQQESVLAGETIDRLTMELKEARRAGRGRGEIAIRENEIEALRAKQQAIAATLA